MWVAEREQMKAGPKFIRLCHVLTSRRFTFSQAFCCSLGEDACLRARQPGQTLEARLQVLKVLLSAVKSRAEDQLTAVTSGLSGNRKLDEPDASRLPLRAAMGSCDEVGISNLSSRTEATLGHQQAFWSAAIATSCNAHIMPALRALGRKRKTELF